MFLPPICTCEFVNEQGEVVDGALSKGLFHWLSPNPLSVPVTKLVPINGTISTSVGCTMPLLIKLLNVLEEAMFGYILLQKVL